MSIIRAGICLLIAFAVLAHGAVEIWSESIFEIGVGFLFVVWAFMIFLDRNRKIYWNPLQWPLLGFLVLGLLQLGLHGTAYSYATRAEVLRLSAYCLIVFLATQSFREKEELRSMVWFLLFLGFAVGLFAIIQHFTFNGKIYWFRELTAGGSPFGPYVNRNHFAGFMEQIVPLGIALLILRGTRRELVPLAVLFTAVAVASLILSASRGGIATLLVELALLAFLAWVHRHGMVRIRGLVVVLLGAGALVAWLGVGRVIERFAEIRPGEVTSERRIGMLKDSWRIFEDHPWEGTGLGTLGVVYPQYESVYDGKIAEHSHNDYVEALAETGIPGALFGSLFLALLLYLAVSRLGSPQSPFSLAVHAGSFTACAGLLVHSFVDFNLHIPSNAAIFLLLGVLTTCPVLAQEVIHSRTLGPRPVSAVDMQTRSGP